MLAKQDRDNANKLGNSAQRVINLAFAFRDATLAVKSARPAPYSWAPFVLQGAPLYFGGRDTGSSDLETMDKDETLEYAD